LECSDYILGDSSYNVEEAKLLGAKKADVLPLCIDIEKWSITANSGIASAMKGHGGVNLVHVGRIAPNKCLEDIIKSFYFYFHKINNKSRLWLVGSDIDTEIYSFELRQLIKELQLQ